MSEVELTDYAEVRQFVGVNGHSIAEWCNGRIEYWLESGVPHVVEIPTARGTVYAHIGDYVVLGHDGAFYTRRADIFE